MRKMLASLVFMLAALPALAQTFQYRAGFEINAGQCVAITQISGGSYAVPCDNTGLDYPVGIGGLIPPAVGVALNSTGPVFCRAGATEPCPPVNPPLVTVQYAGMVTVPVTTSNSLTSATFLGDSDGTGNLNSLGFAFCACNGPTTYVGIFLGYTSAQETSLVMIVQPGYIPTGGSESDSAVLRKKK